MYVYCIINKVNNRMYVGKTNKSVKASKSYMGSGTLIKKAIKKYGKDNFIKEILEENIKKEELSIREMFWIQKLNTKLPNGYNLTDGGEGTLGIKRTKSQIEKHRKAITGKKATKETREKISKSHKGKKKSQEHTMNISKGLTGRKLNPEHVKKIADSNRGKKLSEEQKKMISEFHKGRSTSQETKIKMSLSYKKRVKVQQISLDGKVIATYNSIKEAAECNNTLRTSIAKCLNGSRKTHLGFIWKKLN